ncbi:hypothetical protein ILUMI_12427 [Ignelater luminosus]|uniref:Inositol hexakisphosphate and diphosphoinositol-pentakisphosphate kinase n=1 Tax=Ignelater luminosus TaxID=2038154 RepID=A0A8K0CZK0_IGNLU|nr:hypothetical protein ILUMI_12427 [Ignelater luminosus]
MSYTELEYGYQGLRNTVRSTQFYVGGGDLELCDPSDSSLGLQDMEENGKQVVVGVCAMAKKSQSKPMKEILTRLQEFEYIKVTVFPEEVILEKSVEEWQVCDCLISFHSKGFPLDKAIQYAQLYNPYVINNLHMQYDIQDRRKVYSILEAEGIEIPRYAVLDRDSSDPKHHELVESEDHVEVNGVVFNKPFVEKPVSAEDHNIYIYYPTSAGGGSQRLFRKIGSRSSVYSPESRVRKTGSFIYEDFMPTDGTDVKVYTVGPDYAHAEARKSPALDGKVERDREGKEIRYPVILSNAEKLISRKVCLAFKQAVCGFDLLRANGKSFVCDVNGFSFVKNSNKYYDDCAKILGNMILRELAPTLHIPWSVPFQLDDPPIVPTTFGKMMELRCVVAVIRHGDRTPKQKMKVEVRHPKFFEIFEKYDGYKQGYVKLKRPKQLQEILDIARSLLAEIQQHEADPEIEEKQGKLEQLKSVLEMYGHFSGINRKVQMKYQPKGRPRGSSSDDDPPADPSLVLILKWGGELTPAGRIQAEELGRIFRCMYPGGQGRHLTGEYAGAQGLGLLRLHSTFRHDLKIYASDEGRVQMTAAAFAKGLLALEGELTPILVQMVKSANTNGLLDNDCDSSKYQNMCKARLHELMQLDREFTPEDVEKINPCHSSSISDALDFVKNPVKCCQHVHELIQSLLNIVRLKRDDVKTKDAVLYHGETWELMGRRWGKIEKDFCTKNKRFDISKIPDIYDCIKYDIQHNQHTLQFEQAEELYMYAKYLADIVIPQEYGLTTQEKLTIGQGICTPLLKKIRADLQRNIEESGDETVNRLNPRYSHGVSSPGRHVRTRLYFTSESHVHSLITCLRYGGLLNVITDEQWHRAMEYISMVSELNYMSQVVIMLYEDPTKDPCSEERFHVELHFSPGVNCCVQKNLPPGPGFRPHSRNESVASKNSENTSTTATPEDSKGHCSPYIDEESEGGTEDRYTGTSSYCDFSPPDSPSQEQYYYRQYYRPTNPIPIGSSHTVSGHEAMHLARRLNEELAQQAQKDKQGQRKERAKSPDPDVQSKSYDNRSTQTSGKESEISESISSSNIPSLSVPLQNIISDENTELGLNSPSENSNSNTPIQHSKDDVEELRLTDFKLLSLKEDNFYVTENNILQKQTKDKSLENRNLMDVKIYYPDIHSINKTTIKKTKRSFSDSKILETDLDENTEIDVIDSAVNKGLLNVNNNQLNSYISPLYPSKLKPPQHTPRSLSIVTSTDFSSNDVETTITYSSSLPTFSSINYYNQQLRARTYNEYLTVPTSILSLSPKKLAPVRSLSHPNPIITNPPDSEVSSSSSAKRHRHSIAGQMSYFKMLGFSCGGPLALKKVAGGSANSLFSTAVISGSSSAPNLRDMIPSTASASALEGFGGVPPIRPLETLHNALSLRQLDTFLEQMTAAPLYKTPSSTPPRHPSTPITTSAAQAVSSSMSESSHPPPLKLQSPSNSLGWSGPPSFLSSSSGPSSPGVSDPYSNSKESSDMSSSIVSSDGAMVDNLSHMFLTDLDQDLENIGMLLQHDEQVTGSMEFSDYFTNLQRSHNIKHDDSGDTTPISGKSKIEVLADDGTVTTDSSSADYDKTVADDIDSTSEPTRPDALSSASLAIPSTSRKNSGKSDEFPEGSVTPTTPTVMYKTEDTYVDIPSSIKQITFSRVGSSGQFDSLSSKSNPQNPLKVTKQVKSIEKDTKSNKSNVGSDKWSASKEAFLEISKPKEKDPSKDINKQNTSTKQGTVVVRESYIEPPRISRVSKSLDGKSQASQSLLNIVATTPRRASEGVPVTSENLNIVEGTKPTSEKSSTKRHPFSTQISHPGTSKISKSSTEYRKSSLSSDNVQIPTKPRFTTTLIDEAEIGLNAPQENKSSEGNQ